MASSRPPRRDSSVKRRPRRYASKVRRCRSQRIALRAPLTRLAMTHPQPAFRAPQNPAHERGGLLAREPLGELHGLADGDVGGDVIHGAHLVEREPQDGAVHRAHPVHGPPDRDLREQPVQVLFLALHFPRQPHGVLLEIPPVAPPALERRLDGNLVNVALVENEKRLLAGPPAAQSSDPREVLVRARVHPHPVADVHKERHLHHEAGLQSGGLAPPGGRVALEAWVGLGDLQVHMRGGLDAYHLAVRREHADRAVGHDVPARLPDGLHGDRELVVGLRVHEVEKVPVPVEVGHRAGLGPDALELLPRPEGLLDHRPRVYVAQPRPDERAPLARLDVLEIEDGEPFSIHPNGTTVPELVGGYHAENSPSKSLGVAIQRTANPVRRRDIIAQISGRLSSRRCPYRPKCYRTAARYPEAPIPATFAFNTGETTETCLHRSSL